MTFVIILLCTAAGTVIGRAVNRMIFVMVRS